MIRMSTGSSQGNIPSISLANHLRSIQLASGGCTTEGRVFLLDGGTGEELFRRGVADDRKIWSATAVVESKYHNILREVHKSFLEAGSNAITTNSYGIVPGVGFNDNKIRSEYVATAAMIAREAVHEYLAEQSIKYQQGPDKIDKEQKGIYVLGSLGPLVESYRADLIREHEKGVQEYQIACQALEPYVDGFLAETMSCAEESLQALEAISTFMSKPIIPALVSFTLDSSGNLRDGQSVNKCLRIILDYVKNNHIQLSAILFNCCEPEAISIALARIKSDKELLCTLKDSQICLGAYANRLTAVDPNWTMEASEEPQPFREDLNEKMYWNNFVRDWSSNMGVSTVGGCCGITPSHISHLHNCFESELKEC